MPEIEISKINSSAKSDPEGFILSAEREYRSFISDLSERISSDERIRVVLLAGPSGSGKTTSANLLADGLRNRGLLSFVISLDNFYRDRDDEEYPRLPSGERDFEAVEALNLPELERTLGDIIDGRDFSVPRYDFKLGGRAGVEKYPKISHGCVIIEGLHAMNPKVFEHLPSERILRVFISVSTNVNDDGERILSGRKIRFVRRLVRDSIYRNADAERTLGMWTNVLHGEDKYLYPYRSYADVNFNTFHPFELGVMRQYVLDLIPPRLREASVYVDTVVSAIERCEDIDEALVPDDSLIREFIRGGKYEHLY
jgi:uridine kinase